MMRFSVTRWGVVGGLCAVASAVAWGGQETLSLLSWNTEHYGWERRSVEERKLLEDNMFELVRAVNPDIFLMQETYGSFERFKAALPGYDARLLGRCNCIFSRFPIVATHEPYREKGNYGEPNGGAFNLQVAELDVGGMRLRVCPMAMFWLPYCVKTPADLTADQLLAWESERQNYDAAPRPQAISGILAGMAPFLAERDDVPILVAGDFNSHSHLDWTPATGAWPGHEGRTVPWQVSTRMANAGFTDVFRSLYPDPAAFDRRSDGGLFSSSILNCRIVKIKRSERLYYIVIGSNGITEIYLFVIFERRNEYYGTMAAVTYPSADIKTRLAARPAVKHKQIIFFMPHLIQTVRTVAGNIELQKVRNSGHIEFFNVLPYFKRIFDQENPEQTR